MFTRFLGCSVVGLGLMGSAMAQPAAVLARPQMPTNSARSYNYASSNSPQYGASNSSGAANMRVPARTTSPTRANIARTADAVPAAPMAAPIQPPTAPNYVIDESCGTCMEDCGPCATLCGPPGKFWISAEWLWWATSGQNLPPLATTAPAGTAQNVAGTLGGPGTVVLIGNRQVNDEYRSGLRVKVGMWLDPSQLFGIEANFMYLQPSQQTFAAGSDGSQIITRPFTNATNGLPGTADTQLVSFPGVLSGVTTTTSNTDVVGGGVNFLSNLCCLPCDRLDLLLGYKYLNLQDDLVITENLTALPGSPVPAGTRYVIADRFQTDNQFHGPTIGLNWERRRGHWFLGARAALAMGVSHQKVTITGSTIQPGVNLTPLAGGLLTQPTNIGTYESNHFAVIPEVGLRVGLQVTERMRAFVGYEFLYWSNVARAGDQIDMRVNTNQLPPARPLNGPAVPAYTPKTTDFWMQGVSVGVEFRF